VEIPCSDIIHGVPRGPQKRDARSICYQIWTRVGSIRGLGWVGSKFWQIIWVGFGWVGQAQPRKFY